MQHFLLLVILIASFSKAFAQNEERMINMRGYWRFIIGDDPKYASVTCNDSQWDKVSVGTAWENEGYPDYNGFAWYRTRFSVGPSAKARDLTLQLGNIDDVDEVYLNGVLIGRTGSFPPNYKTAYDQFRRYKIPTALLNYSGDNIIAVRVYDDELGGGLVTEDIGLYASPLRPTPDYDLSGLWKFTIGEEHASISPGYNDRKWRDIVVPGKWESQGVEDYDGIAYYRKKFTLPSYLKGKPLVLLLGKIDDIDEVFINGKFVDGTGHIKDDPYESYLGEYYQQIRGYYIPEGFLKENGENVIVVRVYDGYIDGGIYEGPIGLISQEKYTYFWRVQKKRNQNVWEWLINGNKD